MNKESNITINTEIKSPLNIPPDITTLDLEATKFKLVSEEGWSLDKADQVEILYKAWLSLIKTFPEDMHVPTAEIDEMWHTHILDTRKYMADCYRIFGYFLHHYPYLGMNGPEDTAKLNALFGQTQARMRDMGIDLSTYYAEGCGGGGGDSGGSSCSTAPSSSPTPTPASCSSPASIFPVISSCGSSTNTTDKPRRRPEEDRKKEPPKPETQETPKRGWLPRLGIWGRSVDPTVMDGQLRPDRAATLALQAAKGVTRH